MAKEDKKEDKLKALDAAIAKIEKDFGKGSIMKLGDSVANMNVESIPTVLKPGFGFRGRRRAPWKDCGSIRPGIQR